MPTTTSRGSWTGDLKTGSGRMAGSDRFDLPFTRGTRFAGDEGSNPEELVGAAHAGCFSMFLSSILSNDDYKVNTINTTSAVTIETVDGAPTISTIHLETTADVEGIDAETFAGYAQKAKEGCPVSKALACVKTMTLEATLA